MLASESPVVARVAALLLIVILALQVVAIVRRADRAPHPDETEYLHAAWLMAQGERLYTSFFEHHPPFLFAALRTVADDDVRGYFVRARLLSGAFALVALVAYATILWRARPEAAPIALTVLFASLPLWLIGLTAARAEPFALAFFWCGAALVLLPQRDNWKASVAGGVGIGLVAIAALWNPKWPISSIVVAAFWFARTPRRVLSAAIALAITAVAVLVMHRIAPLDQTWFFTVEFNRAFWPWLSKTQDGWISDSAFLFAPALLRPVMMLVLFLIVGVAFLRKHRIAGFFLLLAIASALELRFVFPWPVLWNHYYLMWALAGAALAGFLPSAVETLLPRMKFPIAVAVMCLVLLIAIANVIALAPYGSTGDNGPYWVSQRFFAERLHPGETVWIDIKRHPVVVRDADYYWFGFFPMTGDLRRTPRGARFLQPRREMPFCAMTGGAETRLRFVSSPRFFRATASEERCFQQLVSMGRIRRTPFAQVYEIVR